MPAPKPILIRFATGTGRNLAKAKNRVQDLESFLASFAKPVRTGETFREYMKLPDAEQVRLKAVNGWWYGAPIDGAVRRRGSGKPRDIITLDFDYATPAFFKELLAGKVAANFRWVLHTSRRHTPEKPRFRIVIPVEPPIDDETYGAASRIIARIFDPEMQFVDKVCFRPAQMMFKPTASKDGAFSFYDSKIGTLLDWQAELEAFSAVFGDWHDIANLPKVEGERLRKTVEKAENPTEKEGPVGDFCRAYDVPAAIEAFLPDVYAPVDMQTSKPRYTYLGGTTVNGAEVQDDGLFLYSHHGSDPCGDMLVNAFDLVRIHKFGEADEDQAEQDKPIGQRASFKAMLEFIRDDPGYRAEAVKSKFDLAAMQADADFDDDDVDGEVQIDPDYRAADRPVAPPAPAPAIREANGHPVDLISLYTGGATVNGHAYLDPVEPSSDDEGGWHVRPILPKLPPPKEGWLTDLEMTLQNAILPTSSNLVQIVQNDLRLRGSFEFNQFSRKVVSRRPIKSKLDYLIRFDIADKVNGDPIEDIHLSVVRAIMDTPNGTGKGGYGIKGAAERDIQTAVEMAARLRPFHPIQSFLKSCERVEGTRCDSLFVDYLGCPDTPYYRDTARLFMLGAVARAFEPGHKFDFTPVMHGPGGQRKSTVCRILGMDLWFGELTANFSDDKKLAEQMAGNWIMEIAELSSLARSQVEPAKQFLSATSTTVRLSYKHFEQTFPRQCVFIGTSNEEAFLVDDTGNRRFWPIRVTVTVIDTDRLQRNVRALWADAYHTYCDMRAAQPYGDLPLYLRNPESIETALTLQTAAKRTSSVDVLAEIIGPWLDQLVRPADDEDFDDSDVDPAASPGAARHREFTTVAEVMREALEIPDGRVQPDMTTNAVAAAIRRCGWVKRGQRRGHRDHPDADRRGRVSAFEPSQAVLDRWKNESREVD